MHKSAMQMQHARDIQRGVGASAGNVSGNGGLAGINTNSLSGLPAVMGGGTEVKPHQCQQCLKSFSSNHQLVQHIRVHTGTFFYVNNNNIQMFLFFVFFFQFTANKN